jgi:hypothetical protein
MGLALQKIQSPAPGGATFSSHMPQTGANAWGLWATYQNSETSQGGYGATWTLIRSTDNGVTWTPFYTSPEYNGPPPSLICDRDNEVWVFQSSYDGAGAIHRILMMPSYNGKHDIFPWPETSSKFTVIYHAAYDSFYSLDNPGVFRVWDPNTLAITRTTTMFSVGMEYPLMSVSGARLLIAGTETLNNTGGLYQDCLFCISDDTGVSVQNAVGTTLPFPIECVTGGGMTSLVESADTSKQTWLASIVQPPGLTAVLGMYMAQQEVPPAMFALAVSTVPGTPDQLAIYNKNTLGDATAKIYNPYGFFCLDGTTLYCIGATATGQIAVIQWMGGNVWETVAVSTQTFTSIYGIAGMRARTPGLPIVLTFVNYVGGNREDQEVWLGVFSP